MTAPAELIDGLILQVLQTKGVAQDVEFLTREGVVPFDILGHPRHIVNLALVEPLDEELECGGVLVAELELPVFYPLSLAIDGKGLVEKLRMVNEEVLMESPLAPVGTDVDFEQWAGE